MTYAELGAVLGVSKDTAANYVRAMPAALTTVRGGASSGPGARVRVYPIAESPNIAEQAGFGDPSATSSATGGDRSPNAESPYIDRRSALRRSPPVDGSPVDAVAIARNVFRDELVEPAR